MRIDSPFLAGMLKQDREWFVRDRSPGRASVLSLVEDQERTLWIGREGIHIPGTATEQCFDHGRLSIAGSNPNHLRRVPEKKTTLMKIRVLRYDSKAPAAWHIARQPYQTPPAIQLLERAVSLDIPSAGNE